MRISQIFIFLVCMVFANALAQTNSLTIAWDPNSESDIQGYRLQRSVNQTNNFQDFGTIYHPATEFIDSGVTPGNLYAYRISAFDSENEESDFSGSVGVGIPQILLSLTQITNIGDTSFVMTPHVYDPDNNQGQLIYQISNQSNVSASMASDGTLTLTPSPADYTGPAGFTLYAEDPIGLNDLKDISFEYIEGITPVFEISIPPVTLNEDGDYQVWMDSCVTINNFQPSQLTWNFSGGSDLFLDYNSVSRVLTIESATPNWHGEDIVQAMVVAPDNSNNSTQFDVTILSVNDTPTLTLSSLTVQGDGADNIIDLKPFADDVDHGVLALNWVFNGYDNFAISWYDEALKLLRITPVDNTSSETGTVTVSDPDGASTSANVLIEVEGVGDPDPVFEVSIPDVEYIRGGSYTLWLDTLVNIYPYGADELTWTFRERPFMDNQYDPATRVLTLQMGNTRRSGSTWMVATATAPDQAVRSDTFNIVVLNALARGENLQELPGGGLPKLKLAPELQMVEDAPSTLDLTELFAQFGGNSAGVLWDLEYGDGIDAIFDASSKEIVITPLQRWFGSTSLSLTGTTEQGQAIDYNTVINVSGRNALNGLTVKKSDDGEVVIDLETEDPAALVLSYWYGNEPAKEQVLGDYDRKHDIRLDHLVADTLYHYSIRITDESGYEFTIKDSTFSTDGLYGHLMPEEFVVYPNPIKPSDGHKEMIFLNLPEEASNLVLYSVAGDRIFEEERLVADVGEYRINVNDNKSPFSSGLYIYVVKDAGARVLKSGRITVIR